MDQFETDCSLKQAQFSNNNQPLSMFYNISALNCAKRNAQLLFCVCNVSYIITDFTSGELSVAVIKVKIEKMNRNNEKVVKSEPLGGTR